MLLIKITKIFKMKKSGLKNKTTNRQSSVTRTVVEREREREREREYLLNTIFQKIIFLILKPSLYLRFQVK